MPIVKLDKGRDDGWGRGRPRTTNWRIHPKAQQEALAGALDSVGWVQQVLVNRRTSFVVDGHARVALSLSRGEPTVPVLYVDLEPAEAALVLATLDPIGAMAQADDEKEALAMRSGWVVRRPEPRRRIQRPSIAERATNGLRQDRLSLDQARLSPSTR